MPGLHDAQPRVDVRRDRLSARLREPTNAVPRPISQLPNALGAGRTLAAEGVLDRGPSERRRRLLGRRQHDGVQQFLRLREFSVRQLLAAVRHRLRRSRRDSRLRRALCRRDLQPQQRMHRRLHRRELLRLRRFCDHFAMRDPGAVGDMRDVHPGRHVRCDGPRGAGCHLQPGDVPGQLRGVATRGRREVLRPLSPISGTGTAGGRPESLYATLLQRGHSRVRDRSPSACCLSPGPSRTLPSSCWTARVADSVNRYIKMSPLAHIGRA